jgi:hypothetical protein
MNGPSRPSRSAMPAQASAHLNGHAVRFRNVRGTGTNSSHHKTPNCFGKPSVPNASVTCAHGPQLLPSFPKIRYAVPDHVDGTLVRRLQCRHSSCTVRVPVQMSASLKHSLPHRLWAQSLGGPRRCMVIGTSCVGSRKRALFFPGYQRLRSLIPEWPRV